MRRSDSIAWSIDFTTARSGAGIAFRYHNPSILQSIALTYLVRVSPQDDIAIATLEQILATPQNERIAVEAAEALLIADVDSALPLSALVNLYDTAEPSAEKETQRRVAKALGKFGEGNAQATTELLRILETAEHEWVLKDAIESLGKVGQGNEEAIAALQQILTNSPSDSLLFPNALLRLAARSLQAIDSGNEQAISSIINLFESADNPATRANAAEDLIAIAPTHPKAIAITTDYLSANNFPSVRLQAAERLSDIGQAEAQVQDTLIDLIVTLAPSDSPIYGRAYFIRQLAQVLEKEIDRSPQMIQSLENAMVAADSLDLRLRLAKVLAQFEPGNEQAIAVVSDVIAAYESITPRTTLSAMNLISAANTLGTIDPQNAQVVATLSPFLQKQQDLNTDNEIITLEEIKFRAALGLLRVGAEDTEAADVLFTLLETAKFEVPWMVAGSLGTLKHVQPPLSTQTLDAATRALADFLPTESLAQTDSNNLALAQGAQSLWELDPGNEQAINTLLLILGDNLEEYISNLRVAGQLVDIAVGNETAINGLTGIVQNHSSVETQLIAADTLIDIVPDSASVVSLLRSKL